MYKLSLRTPSIRRTPIDQETMTASILPAVELVATDRLARVVQTHCFGLSNLWVVEVEGKGLFALDEREVVMPYPAPETPLIAPFRRMWVEIDGCFDDQPFQCYTEGKTWNGAEFPRFTKEWADKLMAACNVTGCAKYDPESDTYDFGTDEIVDDPDNHDYAKGHDIVVDGETIHVYAIGAGSWVWSDASVNERHSANVFIRGYTGKYTVEDESGKNLLDEKTFEQYMEAMNAADDLLWGDEPV